MFFSLPLLLVYYSCVIYIFKVSYSFIENYKKYKNIKSFYGGDLKFTNQYEIVCNTKSILYYENYKQFRRSLKSEIINAGLNTMVIKLDIQNYFENIDISNLMGLVDEYCKPSHLQSNNFDTSTKENIVFFFKFLMEGRL